MVEVIHGVEKPTEQTLLFTINDMTYFYVSSFRYLDLYLQKSCIQLTLKSTNLTKSRKTTIAKCQFHTKSTYSNFYLECATTE